MAYHTTLKNSQEFTAALRRARELAHNITMGMRQIPGTDPDFEVFPYTCVTFYTFYTFKDLQFLVHQVELFYICSVVFCWNYSHGGAAL